MNGESPFSRMTASGHQRANTTEASSFQFGRKAGVGVGSPNRRFRIKRRPYPNRDIADATRRSPTVNQGGEKFTVAGGTANSWRAHPGANRSCPMVTLSPVNRVDIEDRSNYSPLAAGSRNVKRAPSPAALSTRMSPFISRAR